MPSNTPKHAAQPFSRPLYGEAAAIYAMYQGLFIEQEERRERPRPRKPRGGLQERLAAAVTSLFGAPAYAHAAP